MVRGLNSTHRVMAPHLCCGIEVRDGIIVDAAAILYRWTVGTSLSSFEDYCRRKGWTVTPLPPSPKA